MSPAKMTGLFVTFLVAILVYSSMFVVNEWESAIRFSVGKFDKSDFKPGLHWKIPGYHTIQKFDKRILTYDAAEQRYLTKDGNPLIVDYYVKWRIENVETFYQKMRGRESEAVLRFNAVVNKGLSDAFGKRTEWEVISEARDDVMNNITLLAREQVKDFGIKIVDVRTKRIELPPNTFKKIFERMRSERLKEANERRASGKGEGDRIQAEADKEKKIMLAEGYNEAQRIRGEGDAKASEIYARAYNKNAEFYSFYRSLDAYKRSFGGNGDMLVIEPDSEFFDYFKKAQPKR